MVSRRSTRIDAGVTIVTILILFVVMEVEGRSRQVG
jgi:hypothetical protein